MEQIINIEANIERIKEFLENYLSKLDFNSAKIRITDENGNIDTLEFKDAKAKLDKYYYAYKYPLVAENCLFLLGSIPGRLDIIREKIDESFEELIKIIDVQNQAIEEFQEELSMKESEIKELQDKIDFMKEETQNNKIDNLQNQINSLMTTLIGNNKTQNNSNFEGKHPTEYFTEDIETPIGDDDFDSLSVSEPNDNLQEAHNDVLELIKADGLYPLHKINPEQAKEKYLEYWTYVMMKHNLDESEYPSFIDNLEKYQDKDENYLDKVF